MELRNSKTTLSSNGDLVVEGYVNKPGALSEILGGPKKFREKIAPGAFKKAIESRNREIDFLAEHDNKQVLASTRNSSLELREDKQGLFMSAKISPTSYGKDYFTLISDGLISSMSFGFRALKDSWDFVEGLAIRTVHELELFEVSAVKDPAYSQSTISARNIDVEDVEVPDEKSEYSDKKQNESRNFNMQKMEVLKSNEYEEMLRNPEYRALSVTTDGAALIPQNTTQEIIKKMEEVSPAFAQARKFPSVNGNLKVAKENDTVTGGFFGEGASILEESIAFTSVELKQKRLGAALSLSNQLINDSAVDITGYCNDLLSRRVAKTAEKAIFNGNGTTEFVGILGDASVSKTNLAVATPLSIDTLMDIYSSLHPDFLDGSAFYMSRPMMNKAIKLKDANGHFYLQNGVVNGKPNYTLFNQPVFVTEGLQAGTTIGQTPIVFANLGQAYSILVKQEMAIRQIVDGPNALRGSQLLVLDGYMDGAVTNSSAITKLAIIA